MLAIAEAGERREPEAIYNDALASETVTSGAAAAKKPRIIRAPVVDEDPTISLKTWTGSHE